MRLKTYSRECRCNLMTNDDAVSTLMGSLLEKFRCLARIVYKLTVFQSQAYLRPHEYDRIGEDVVLGIRVCVSFLPLSI